MVGTLDRTGRTAVALGLVTVVWCLPGIGVRSTIGARVAVDEPQYLLSATSLWEDGDLDISDELRDEGWRTYHEATLPTQTKVLDGGRQVSPHDPLLPLVLAVPMGLGGWVAAKVVLALVAGALAAAMVWVAVRRFGVSTARAATAVACFSLSPPLAVYATQVYPELPAALAVTLGIGAVTGPRSRACALGAALAVIALPWLSVKYAPVALVLAAIALWRFAAHRRALVVLFVAAGIAFAAVHLAVYGGITPYAAGDHFVGGELTVSGTRPNWLGRSRRLLALLVDRDYGLVAWQPAFLLAIPAVAAGIRRRSLLVPILAAGWLMATFPALTMHGFWWPGRQVVVVVPCIVLLVARWAPTALLRAGAMCGALVWWWLIVDGLQERITWVVHWRTADLLRSLLVPANADAQLAVWTVVAVILAAIGALRRGDEDALAGERTDADDPLAHADGHRAVG